MIIIESLFVDGLENSLKAEVAILKFYQVSVSKKNIDRSERVLKKKALVNAIFHLSLCLKCLLVSVCDKNKTPFSLSGASTTPMLSKYCFSFGDGPSEV